MSWKCSVQIFVDDVHDDIIVWTTHKLLRICVCEWMINLMSVVHGVKGSEEGFVHFSM